MRYSVILLGHLCLDGGVWAMIKEFTGKSELTDFCCCFKEILSRNNAVKGW